MTAPRVGPIIMSAPMILSLKARRKFQTRRTNGLETVARTARLTGYGKDHRGRFAANFDDPEGDGRYCIPCTYGGPGDQLYVREGVRHVTDRERETRGLEDEFDPLPLKRRHGSVAEYIADGNPAPCDAWGWKNKALPAIHMPRGMSRFTLDLEAVRVERLQAISEHDAIAEGLSSTFYQGETLYFWPGGETNHRDPRDAYRAGWEWLNGPASWALNPWVWVLSFDPRER